MNKKTKSRYLFLFVLMTLCAGCGVKEMTISEYNERQKDTFSFRGFSLSDVTVEKRHCASEGTVRDSNGKELSCMYVSDPTGKATVWYNSDEIQPDVKQGDSMFVEGSFERITEMGMARSVEFKRFGYIEKVVKK